MWFSKQKEKDEPLKVLKEREIQEKLYGRFRKPYPETVSGDANSGMPENQTATITAQPKPAISIEPPKPKEASQSRPSINSTYQTKTSAASESYRQAAIPRSSRSLRILNIPVMIKLLGFVVLSIVVFFAAWWFAIQFHRSKSPVNEQPVREGVSTLVAPAPQAYSGKPSSSETASRVDQIEKVEPASGSPSANEPALPSNFYSIQICTYYSESDANKLIEEMKALNIPAFHRTSGIRGSDSKLHMVMLGKDATFQEAQKRLEQFQKTEISKKFLDAYVRRVS